MAFKIVLTKAANGYSIEKDLKIGFSIKHLFFGGTVSLFRMDIYGALSYLIYGIIITWLGVGIFGLSDHLLDMRVGAAIGASSVEVIMDFVNAPLMALLLANIEYQDLSVGDSYLHLSIYGAVVLISWVYLANKVNLWRFKSYLRKGWKFDLEGCEDLFVKKQVATILIKNNIHLDN
ncbi:TPA: hypothetical protein RQJ75_004203 [Vibrio vulnificus]|nr:hypothetical protein [Vibrio vulnificus]MCA3979832.1 hypothetical protein [Vibrio vulnificus]MCA4006609.1 hypothetical protein [Vibrio vulnificus]MDS1846534.1 hypothetical protein [Vibrio vulnificus]QBN14122.1 hypothetical protein E2I22_07770 [Vibrio vulnificus]HAS6377918.1 hypothetical protein [Vibrio vulnificus]